MPLTKKQKSVIYEDVVERLKGAELALFASYKGLSSEEVFQNKKKIKATKASFQLVKNTLLKKAFSDLGIEAQSQGFWKGETAMLVSPKGDFIPAVKSLAEWIKQNQKIKIKGGILASSKKWLSDGDVKTLAALPGLEELRGQCVNVIAQPLASLPRVLNALVIQFLLTLKEVQKKQEASVGK